MRYQVIRRDIGWVVNSSDYLTEAKRMAIRQAERNDNDYYIFDTYTLESIALNPEGEWEEI